ncbi:MAG TPA: deoxyribonuclease IV [Fimbriimonadaceae bacterium]|nr:deoxyribonuclease IV [Fimbriimonadaceae bacterium]
MALLGAHMKASKGLGSALREAKAMGAQAAQVFTSSPQMWRASSATPEKIADFKAAQAETGLTQVVSHDSYLVNLCAPEAEIREKSLNALKGEIQRCAAYGIPFVVSHMGAHKGQGEAYGIETIAKATLAILAETPEEVMLLMETTAGSGSALGATFEQLGAVLDACKRPPRLGACLDTCHIFAAGYEIRTRETYEMVFEHFDNVVGLDRLKAFHLNDSKKGLGSHVDRHESIGKGELGLEPFRFLVNDPRFAETPMLLETAVEEHASDLATLRSLIAS